MVNDNEEGLDRLLFGITDPDEDWSVQVVIREGKLVVLEHKDDEVLNIDYEAVFMNFITTMNKKVAYEFLNESNLEALTSFLADRRLKIN